MLFLRLIRIGFPNLNMEMEGHLSQSLIHELQKTEK